MAAATLASLALVARNGLGPFQRPLTFALAFWCCYVPFACGLALLLAVAGRVLGRVSADERIEGAWAWIAGVGFLGLVLIGSPLLPLELLGLSGPGRTRWLSLACYGLATAALLLLERSQVSWRLTLLAALAYAGAFFPSGPGAGSLPDRVAPAKPAQRVLLVGVDGASWTYLDPLLERGQLPHFAALKERGAWGRLKSFAPTRSPIIWTTIVTGKPPQEHGIHGFMDTRIRGVRDALPPLQAPPYLGFEWLRGVLEQTGQIYERPTSSTSRRVPAYWNIASSNGSPVNVVNWWATWPAEPIHGNMISELPFNRPRDAAPSHGVSYPEALYGSIARSALGREQVTLDQVRRFADVNQAELRKMQGPTADLKGIDWLAHFVSLFETTRRFGLLTLELSRRRYGAPADTLLLFSLVDTTSHTALRYSNLVSDHLDATPAELAKYGGAVGEAYRSVDDALGALMDAFGGENVLVISDHGFELQEDGVAREYAHDRAPDGIFLAAGPAFRASRVEGLSVYDVLPLLLYLKGFPVALDLRGRVPLQAFTESFASKNPVRRIASYGTRDPPAAESAEADPAMLERLRALGYVK